MPSIIKTGGIRCISTEKISVNQRSQFPVINPATEEISQQVIRGNAREAELAIEAVRRSFPAWSKIPSLERARKLHSAADKMRLHDVMN